MFSKLIGKEVVWLYKVANKKRLVGVLVIIQALISVNSVVYVWLLSKVIDAAVAQDKQGFFNFFLWILLNTVVKIALAAFVRYMEEHAKSHMENTFKQHLYKQILKKDYETVTNIHSGEWMNRLISDTIICATGVVDIPSRSVALVVKMASALGMILYFEPFFAWIIIPSGILMMIITYFFRRIQKKLHKDIREKDGALRIFLQEHISSLLVLRAFTGEEQSEKDAWDKMEEHKKSRMKRMRFSNFCRIGFASVVNGLYIFGGVGYCGYGILTGTISQGTFVAMLQLISQIQTPFANITGVMPRVSAMLASAERLMEIENFSDDYKEEPKSLSEIEQFYQTQFEGIAFEKVSFTYQPLAEQEIVPIVLDDFSLEIQKGDYVAFTGHSGCGKSTVLKLLLSLYPLDSGECYLISKDNKMQLTSAWRRLFAYVPQGNHLMCGTIRELIAFSNKEWMYADDKIKKALEIACANEFLDELELGLDTVLGEKGHGLSEGQMQRLAIARAVFSNRPILLLDEATSALDDATERRVLDNLKNMTDKTVLIVTHRMKALEICNKVAKFTEQCVILEKND